MGESASKSIHLNTLRNGAPGLTSAVDTSHMFTEVIALHRPLERALPPVVITEYVLASAARNLGSVRSRSSAASWRTS
jgi:hypothetical protein